MDKQGVAKLDKQGVAKLDKEGAAKLDKEGAAKCDANYNRNTCVDGFMNTNTEVCFGSLFFRKLR